MSDLKTQPTAASVDAFIDSLDSERRRDESRRLVAILRDVTGEPPVMWGERIVGFGRYHYRYASGREGDWMRVGFAPGTRHLSLHLMSGAAEAHSEILARLGPHRTGAGCVYLPRLDAVDEDALRELVAANLARLEATYGADASEAGA